MRGRSPLPRAVHCFQDCGPPPEAVLDTSFVIQVLNAQESQHAECVAFMESLTEKQTLLVYNRLLEIELVEVAFKLAVKEQHGSKGWPSKRTDGRVRRRAGRLTEDLLDSWRLLVSTCPSLLVELHEVADDVPAAMTKWGLASYDAVHASTAAVAGTKAMITNDVGFGQVPESVLSIYTDRGRVRSVRRHRGGR